MSKMKFECMGICECCLDEYDTPSVVKLYRLKGNLICGGCASEFEGDRKCAEMAYGRD